MSTLVERIMGVSRRPLGYEEAKRVAEKGSVKARRALAASGEAQPEILYFLAEDRDASVRHAVAANAATPRQADLLLVADPDDEIRCELARKIGRLAPALPADMADKVARLTLQALETLAADQLPRVRQIVAEEIKRCDNLPRDLIRRLAGDAELAVAAPILEYSPLLSDAELLEIVDSDPVRGAPAVIARRTGLAAAVADAIVRSEDAQAVRALLANETAQIREDTLDRIVDAAAGQESWHAPLVKRGELSARVVARVATFVSFALLGVLENRSDLPADALRDVRRVVRERLEREAGRLAGESAPAPAADDDALLAAIAAGDRAAVVQAIARRAALAPESVERVFASKSGKAITAVAWKAGLGMRTAVLLQTKLAHVPPGKVVNARDGVDYPLDPAELELHLSLVA